MVMKPKTKVTPSRFLELLGVMRSAHFLGVKTFPKRVMSKKTRSYGPAIGLVEKSIGHRSLGTLSVMRIRDWNLECVALYGSKIKLLCNSTYS